MCYKYIHIANMWKEILNFGRQFHLKKKKLNKLLKRNATALYIQPFQSNMKQPYVTHFQYINRYRYDRINR